ncbi:hypothetical protein [Pseudoxanthomonas winnipegensis]|uniref:Uncharacterized protein n=1 Tax=Pseudoxanthomonas winnipegensis TaxID=2480810 RepID=A0A4Q8M591_9GAMM|nr:hypothetical protein [Pseudoxanthomonas winnipegensis]TAA41569.1 hypothetical protein EA655_11555 [Pseudoxanthomonas winnipegensis]
MLLQELIDKDKGAQASLYNAYKIFGVYPKQRLETAEFIKVNIADLFRAAKRPPKLSDKFGDDLDDLMFHAERNASIVAAYALVHDDLSLLHELIEASEDPRAELFKQMCLLHLIGKFEFANVLMRGSNSDFWSYFETPSLLDVVSLRFHLYHLLVSGGINIKEVSEHDLFKRLVAMNVDRSHDYDEDRIQKTRKRIFEFVEVLKSQLESKRLDDAIKAFFTWLLTQADMSKDDFEMYMREAHGASSFPTMLERKLFDLNVVEEFN